jgi:hypothetical protein
LGTKEIVLSDIKDCLRRAHEEGWAVSKTPGGHVKLLHPDASCPVFASSTPSDWRAEHNLTAQLRRALSVPAATNGSSSHKAPSIRSMKAKPASVTRRKTSQPGYFTGMSWLPPLPPVADSPPQLIEPSREAVFAWGLASMRLRQKGVEPSTLRALRARFRRDIAYHASIIAAYRETPVVQVHRMRAQCRTGGVISPAEIPPEEITPVEITSVEITSVEITPGETRPVDSTGATDNGKDAIMEKPINDSVAAPAMQPTINQLTAALQDERLAANKVRRELAELRLRIYHAQTATSELEQQKEIIQS